ncbi:hypothetical protein Hanom_Chr03g00186521 [Helianthus anomalus]
MNGSTMLVHAVQVIAQVSNALIFPVPKFHGRLTCLILTIPLDYKWGRCITPIALLLLRRNYTQGLNVHIAQNSLEYHKFHVSCLNGWIMFLISFKCHVFEYRIHVASQKCLKQKGIEHTHKIAKSSDYPSVDE